MVLTIYGSCASSFGEYWVFVSIYHLITQEASKALPHLPLWCSFFAPNLVFIAIVHESRWKDYAEMMLFAKLQIITFPLSALPINRGDGWVSFSDSNPSNKYSRWKFLWFEALPPVIPPCVADGVGTFTEAVSVAGATLAPSSQSNSLLTHTIRLKSIVGLQPYSYFDEYCFIG